MSERLENLPCEERMRKWGLFYLQKRRCRETEVGAGLRSASQHLQGGYQDSGAWLCTMLHGGRAKDNRHELQQERFKLDIWKDILMVKRVRQWSGYPPREVVQPPFLEAFKARPDKTHSNLVSSQFGLKST